MSIYPSDFNTEKNKKLIINITQLKLEYKLYYDNKDMDTISKNK